MLISDLLFFKHRLCSSDTTSKKQAGNWSKTVWIPCGYHYSGSACIYDSKHNHAYMVPRIWKGNLSSFVYIFVVQVYIVYMNTSSSL